MRYCEAGWSLLSGLAGTVLAGNQKTSLNIVTICHIGITAYLYLAAAKVRAERARSQRRRRQMHNAIMSSCRQEIALAIRAKMTVM